MTNDPNDQFYIRIKMMPALPHWPVRSSPFKWELSQVVAHIKRVAQCDQETAQRLFVKAAKKKVILFNKATLCWSGNRNWVPRTLERGLNAK